jgi:hypothetical protein
MQPPLQHLAASSMKQHPAACQMWQFALSVYYLRVVVVGSLITATLEREGYMHK